MSVSPGAFPADKFERKQLGAVRYYSCLPSRWRRIIHFLIEHDGDKRGAQTSPRNIASPRRQKQVRDVGGKPIAQVIPAFAAHFQVLRKYRCLRKTQSHQKPWCE